MESLGIKLLKKLEEENQWLKKMFAATTLNHRILKGIVEKAVNQAIRREIVDYAMDGNGVSLRRTCRVVCSSNSVYQTL